MTKNQLQYAANKEAARANRAKEIETQRANVATEAIRQSEVSEKVRSNRRNEALKDKEITAGNKIKRTDSVFKSLAPLLPFVIKAASNDPAWYNNYPDLVRDTGSIAYQGRLGKAHAMTSKINLEFPGVNTIALLPTLGISGEDSGNAPINKSARYLYSEIQANTSYNKDYEQSDVMLYLGAVLNNMAIYCHLVRAYNYAFLRSPKNDYLGPALAQAMGFQWDDLKRNLPRLRAALDMHKADLEKFFVPSNLDIFKRYAHMFSYVYKDGSQQYDMDQLYFAVPSGTFKFGLNSETSAGELQYSKIDAYQSTQLTVEDWISMLEEMDAAIISNGYTDFANISGDLEKTFGTINKVEYAPIADVPNPTIVESDEIGHQFMNAIVYATDDKLEISNITQNPENGNLAFSVGFKASVYEVQNINDAPILLRSHYTTMTELDNIVASRWMPIVNMGSIRGDIVSCGTELPTAFYTYSIQADGSITARKTSSYHVLSVEDIADGLSPEEITAKRDLFDLSFKWRPLKWTKVVTDMGVNNRYFPGSFDRWAYVSKETIAAMHDTALRSLLFTR